jgi:hypothetical protein
MKVTAGATFFVGLIEEFEVVSGGDRDRHHGTPVSVCG